MTSVFKRIGRYSTTHKGFVSGFILPIWVKSLADDLTHTGSSNFVLKLYDLKNLSAIEKSNPKGFLGSPQTKDWLPNL